MDNETNDQHKLSADQVANMFSEWAKIGIQYTPMRIIGEPNGEPNGESKVEENYLQADSTIISANGNNSTDENVKGVE